LLDNFLTKLAQSIFGLLLYTTWYHFSHSLINSGILETGCCQSQSRVITQSQRADSIHALIAISLPKFLLKFIHFTFLCSKAIFSISYHVLSLLQSFIKIIS